MARESLLEFFDEFERCARDTAYLERRGYRTIRTSYGEVLAAARGFARELEARGVEPGERVVLWGENSVAWAVAFFGCLLSGAVAVPIDQIAAPVFAARVARQVDAKLVLASQEKLAAALERPAMSLDEVLARARERPGAATALPNADRKTIAEIVFTSGTTAEPKGVVITHGNILANLEPLEVEIRKYLKYERPFHPLRFLNLVPLSHVFGQFMGLLVPPLLGATVIFQGTMNPAEVIDTIRRERVSVLVTVPRVLETLRAKIERDIEAAGWTPHFQEHYEAARRERFYRRWWRFRRIHARFGWKFWALISGGAALPAETEAFWDRLGFAVIQGYGLTETTSLVSVNHPFRLGKGSIGKPLPGREIRLDVNGEILVRGESIATGYWRGDQDERPAGGENPEWFRTGDVGELDADGNLYFKGRKKEVIVTPAGMNIYPADLESALRAQPEVRECAVVGIEHEGNAEPCAVLILREGAGAAADVVSRANESLADYQRMRRWFVWPDEDFPRTATGKPRTSAIRAAVKTQGGAAVTMDAAAHNGGLAEMIARVAGPESGLHAAGRGAALELSSLDRVELLAALEDRYQVDLNETQFAEAKTVADVERLLRRSAPRRSDFPYPRWAQRRPVTWLRSLVYYLLTWPATLLLGYPRVRGRENLLGVRGPVLIVSNHITRVDVGFLLAALPARLRHRLAVAMGGERLLEMLRPPRAWPLPKRWLARMNYALVVALFNVFSLPKLSGFRESFRFAGESVDRGFSVLVFPEGRTTPDGKLLPFRAGIGLLANNLNVPVVPMRIDGLYKLRLAGKVFTLPGKVRVTIGAPVCFPDGSDPEHIASELERIVTGL